MTPSDLRGGDHWYNARPLSFCYRAAVVVHRLGTASSHDVASACGLPVAKAYEVLVACCRRPHIYHVQRVGHGRFARITRERSPAHLPTPTAGR